MVGHAPMNERKIRELFKKAGGKTSLRNLMSNPVQVVETNELWDDHIEQFAELIIQECRENFSKVWYEQGLDIRGADISKFMTRFEEQIKD